MATLGSLAVGTDVYDPFFNGTNKDSTNVVWRVIGHNHDGNNTTTLICRVLGSEGSIYGICFDDNESSNPDTEIKNDGNSRYDLSNIFQFLNSNASSNWYSPTHTYDEPPFLPSSTGAGFLYYFSEGFKSALQTVTKSYRKYGESALSTISGKVHVISYSEITGQSYDGLSDGTQYELFTPLNDPSIYISASELIGNRNTQVFTRTPSSQSKLVCNIAASKTTGLTYSAIKARVGNAVGYIITLPSNTVVSTDTYKFNDESLHAMINMPLHIEINGGKNKTRVTYDGGETFTLKFKVFDDPYNVTSLVISNSADGSNPLLSLTNLQKNTEYTYTGNVTDLTLGVAKNFYFIATDSNDRTFTVTHPVTWDDASPYISVYDDTTGEWVETNPSYASKSFNYHYDTTITKPITFRVKVHDADDIAGIQTVYAGLRDESTHYYDLFTVTTHDTEFEYTIPDSAWMSMSDGSRTIMFIVSNDELVEGQYNVSNGSAIYIHFQKATPAPYVTVESTEIGQQNVAFTVDYTPDTDTLQALTLVTVALDGNTISSINNPIAGSTLTLNITKAMVYNLSIGNHTLTFTVTDDLSQTGTTTVTFTRYNETPNVIIPSDLGRKNVGFDISFGVSDDEGDVSSVKMYLDSTATSPIKEWTDVATGSTLTHTISKETLYGLSLGNHKIYVVAEDEFGYATVDADFTRYNDAPVVTATQDSTVHYDDFDVTYTVTDSEDDTVNLTFKIGEATVATVTDVEKDTTLTQSINISGETHGNKTLSIVATDSQGQTSTTTLDFVISTFPVITAEEIGGKTEAFTSTFTVDDADGDDLSVIATLGLVELVNLSNAPHNTPITLDITSAIFNGLEYGNHTINISVTDSGGATTTENVTFQKRSMPTMTINTPIPHEIDQELVISVTYDNADGTEVVLRALIDGVEVPQEILQDAEQETP